MIVAEVGMHNGNCEDRTFGRLAVSGVVGAHQQYLDTVASVENATDHIASPSNPCLPDVSGKKSERKKNLL
jgi:hypothetical protein